MNDWKPMPLWPIIMVLLFALAASLFWLHQTLTRVVDQHSKKPDLISSDSFESGNLDGWYVPPKGFVQLGNHLVRPDAVSHLTRDYQRPDYCHLGIRGSDVQLLITQPCEDIAEWLEKEPR